MTALRRAAAVAGRYVDDAVAIVGLVLVALGAGLYSPPLMPIVLGLGLLLAVRAGSD